MLEKSPGLTSVRIGVAPRRLPIDLNHLHSQTLGNKQLQREVLKLFLGHSLAQYEAIRNAKTITERKQAAHSLVGSARGIGAFTVGYIANEIELAQGPVEGRIKALDAALQVAHFFISDYLAD
jgi:HPt (histidine-containing phosphotransfer) domain-containing protein